MPQVGSIRHFLTQKKQFHVPVQKPHDFRQFCIDQLWLDKQKLCERGGQTIASTHGTENIEKKKKIYIHNYERCFQCNFTVHRNKQLKLQHNQTPSYLMRLLMIPILAF